MSSIVLGLNDGLIELTGALVGFSFALNNPKIVAMSGLITGLAATLSMAASSFMQARYEQGKNPRKSALYTGVTYLIVMTLLVLPFLLVSNIILALIPMAIVIFLIIVFVSYYTSILFERQLKKQFTEMAFLSIGVAAVTFVVGLLARAIFSGLLSPLA